MLKRCEMCGNQIEAQDNRRKYCDSCRKLRKHFFDANAVKKSRDAARERRKQDKETIMKQAEEIALLRAELIRQREKVAILEARHETD